MKALNQARGFNAQLTLGFESTFNTAATDGTTIAHNGSTLQGGRELNESDTIVPNRSPASPFQGNGDVSGGISIPNDTEQLSLFLKAAFGAPETTTPADAKTITAVADASEGKSKLTLGSAHGYAVGDYFAVYGTTNYNGEYQVLGADATTVTVRKTYVAESFTAANATKTGFKHVFKVKPSQPSLTIEQLHVDIAEMLLYTGCKVSRLAIGADSNGQENVVSCDFMGSKMTVSKSPLAISGFATAGSGSATKVTITGHGFANGDRVAIAGSVNYDGVWTVASKADNDFQIDATYVAETIDSGKEPSCCKAQIATAGVIPIKRLNTFSAVVHKDGAEYKGVRNKEITFDFGLDGEQRVIGDKGFRSEIPEGKISITTGLTVLVKSADWIRAGEKNTTIASKLVFEQEYGIGKLEIDLPECKCELTGVPIEGPAGLVQQINLQAFCSDISAEGSAATVTLTNSRATV